MIRAIHGETLLSAGALCLLVMAPASVIAGEAYTWTQIVIPNATIQNAFGLNDLGQVAVTDLTGTVSGIYQNGRFTPLPVPPAGLVVNATGVNDAGVIVGGATDALSHEKGFILNHGVYKFFSRPGWPNTEARAIGASGLVTGWSFQDGYFPNAGFLYDPAANTFTDVTPAGSDYTIVQGINKFNRVSGHGREQPGLGRYAFISQPRTSNVGTRTLVPFLDRIVVAAGPSSARGINDAGVITGYTVNSAGQQVGFVGNASHGYQLLVPPGGDAAGVNTFCQGINNARQVVCGVADRATGITLGAYIGSPPVDDPP
jgi:hypothetical protein